MPIFRTFGFALLAAFLALDDAAAQCPPHNAQLVVTLDYAPPAINDAESYRSLAARRAREVGGGEEHVVGATSPDVAWEIGIVSDAILMREVRCWTVETLEIHIESRPVIWIAREAAGDPCLHEAVLEHERRHVALDRESVLPALREKLQTMALDWLREVPPAVVHSREEMQTRHDAALAFVRGKMMALLDEAGGERRALHHARIDTLEERRRMTAICGGAWARILGR